MDTLKTEERRVPVQGDGNYSLRHDDSRRGNAHYPGTVSWEEHCEAWAGYAKRYSGQDAEKIAERGGFGYDEMTEYMGHEPKTWQVHEQFRERHELATRSTPNISPEQFTDFDMAAESSPGFKKDST